MIFFGGEISRTTRDLTREQHRLPKGSIRGWASRVREFILLSTAILLLYLLVLRESVEGRAQKVGQMRDTNEQGETNPLEPVTDF